VNVKIRRKLERRKRRLQFRLDKAKLKNLDKPVFTAANIRYEISDRVRGIGYGGVGALHLLARRKVSHQERNQHQRHEPGQRYSVSQHRDTSIVFVC